MSSMAVAFVTWGPSWRDICIFEPQEATVHESSMPEAMSSADLVKELTSNASLLVQRQVKLATLEAKQELQKGKTMAELLGTAGLCAYACVILLLVAAALGIGAALD